MSSRVMTVGGSSREGGDHGYSAPLTSAKFMLLTAFKPDGSAVSTPVRVVADGDRVYFRAWDGSGICKRLRHTDWVQAVPCTVLGLCSFGPWLDATARVLAGEEASRAAGLFTRKYPDRRRSLSYVVPRIRGGRAVYYELLAEAETGESP
jgi:PPOX class probable F420-dependent enzyme